MVEIFADIPVEIKKQHSDFIDMCFKYFELPSAADIILKYVNTCRNPEEQEFIDFYFNLKMEILKNEDNNDLSEESTR